MTKCLYESVCLSHFVKLKHPFVLQFDHMIGSECKVLFEQNEITLDIPAEGIVLASGWSITPLGTTKV